MAEVQLLPEAVEDIADLDGSERKLVFKALKKLETDPGNRGAALGSGLTTFRKLVVGSRRFRIVFRVGNDGNVVVVWVVATRVDSECYDLAMSRLSLDATSEISGELKQLVQEVFGEAKP